MRMAKNILPDILKKQVVVKLTQPAHGFWDGGAKSRFIFTPSIERSPGKPAIRWGSYEANLWFVIECGQKSPAKHLVLVKNKLMKGNPPREITVENIP